MILGGWSGMLDAGSSLFGCRLFVTGKREREFLAIVIGIIIVGCVDVVATSACICPTAFGWFTPPEGKLCSRPVWIEWRVLFTPGHGCGCCASPSPQRRRSSVGAFQLGSNHSSSLGGDIEHDFIHICRQWYYMLRTTDTSSKPLDRV